MHLDTRPDLAETDLLELEGGKDWMRRIATGDGAPGEQA